MIAALVLAGSATAAVLLAVPMLRTAGLLTPPPAYGSAMVARHLADYSWRAEMLRRVHTRWADDAAASLHALAPIYAALYRPAPEAPGIDIVARWWEPPAPDHTGRPPLTIHLPLARRTTVLIGASS